MTTLDDAARAIRRSLSPFEKRRVIYNGFLGNGSGLVSGSQNNRSFVRIANRPAQEVFNFSVPNLNDLPVEVGYRTPNTQRMEVLGVDFERLTDWGGASYVVPHGHTHTPNDPAAAYSDPVWIQKRALVPLMARATSPASMTVRVFEDFYPFEATWKRFAGGTSADLTSYVPGAGLKRLVTIYINATTNALGVLAGDEFALVAWGGSDSIMDYLAIPPAGSIPIVAVLLTSATTSIVEADLYDIRLIYNAVGGTTVPAYSDAEGDPALLQSDLSALDGTSSYPSRRDHRHALNVFSSGLPTGIQAYAAAGISAFGARIDHVHSIGSGVLKSYMFASGVLGGGGSGIFPWFNVRTYGATGNGATDDTSSISAAIAALNAAGGGVLYFPYGTYKTSGGFDISTPSTVKGDGNTSEFGTITLNSASQVICTSSTAILFNVSDNGTSFEDLALTCTHATPTAGSAIHATTPGATSVFVHSHIRNCTINGFYRNLDLETAFMWHVEGCYILGPVAAGVRTRNTFWEDWGDFTISNTIFHPGERDGAIGLEHLSGGGMLMTNCKFDGWVPVSAGVPDTGSIHRFGREVDVAFASDSSNIQISNCSFENWDDDAIRIVSTGTIACNNIVINGCQFGGYGASGYAIVMSAATVGYIVRVVIANNIFLTTTSAVSAISLTKIKGVRLNGNINDASSGGFPTFLTQSGCEDVLNLELADFSQSNYGTAVINVGTTTGASYSDVDATNAKITFTPSSFGYYRVTFTFAHYMDGTGIDVFFRLTDGTTNSPGMETYNASGASVRVITLSYIFSWTEASHSVKLQKRIVAGTITTNQIQANSAANVELYLQMAVERIGT